MGGGAGNCGGKNLGLSLWMVCESAELLGICEVSVRIVLLCWGFYRLENLDGSVPIIIGPLMAPSR